MVKLMQRYRRHICLFYLGHIPAFLDIFLSRYFKEPHTEPEYFKDIFEVCTFHLGSRSFADPSFISAA